MGVSRLIDALATDVGRATFAPLYGDDTETLDHQLARYCALLNSFAEKFADQADGDVSLFSAPGRTEVGGNHTDHNHGRVLAAAVNLDTIAVAAPTEDQQVTVYSEGYERPFAVDLADLSVRAEERGTSESLIRGVAAGLKERGFAVGGFRACVTSNVAVGSGLSSSAAFEVLLGTILSRFYNSGEILPGTVAMAGQFAENRYFGKPSGLMDQMASATGGFVTIDFAEPECPAVERVEADFASANLALVVTNTGGSHADLTQEYASIQREMKAVAEALGGGVLRDVGEADLLDCVGEIRNRVGDRAILRALHFFGDHDRVAEQVEALRAGDFDRFLALVNESGRSSWTKLQNCYVGGAVEQGVSLGLALSETVLAGHGAWRVHGGGFAGTILAFVPIDRLDDYAGRMEAVFGRGTAQVLRVREPGAIALELG